MHVDWVNGQMDRQKICVDFTNYMAGRPSLKINPLAVKLFNLNVHPLEVVSR